MLSVEKINLIRISTGFRVKDYTKGESESISACVIGSWKAYQIHDVEHDAKKKMEKT